MIFGGNKPHYPIFHCKIQIVFYNYYSAVMNRHVSFEPIQFRTPIENLNRYNDFKDLEITHQLKFLKINIKNYHFTVSNRLGKSYKG